MCTVEKERVYHSRSRLKVLLQFFWLEVWLLRVPFLLPTAALIPAGP